MANLKLLAIKIGDEVKYNKSVNEIDRIANAIFDFECLEFPQDNITSVRAKLIYDWVMTLDQQEMPEEEKLSLLEEFVNELVPKNHQLRDLFDKKTPNEVCIKDLQGLERAIANIKEATMYLVLGYLSDGETFYNRSYASIEYIIEKLKKECNLDLIHLNPHKTESSILSFLSLKKVTEDNVDDYLSSWYDPLEESIRNQYPINKKLDRIPQPSIKEVKQITQHFHGDIENFASGDINYYNTTIYLNALIKTIEESEEIPEEDKKKLVDKIKDIANNPYVSGIAASLIVEAIKTGLVGR